MQPESSVAARWHPSPNHGERLGGRRPDCLVLHYTGMPTGEEALARLCDPAAEVSCHYFVRENGEVLQLVAEDRRAWHAGRSSWAGETDLNSCSLGIEIVNAGHPGGLPPYPEVQIAAVGKLCRDLCRRHQIPPERVLAHSDVAPDRKIDPGERFPWQALYRAGVGLWVPPAPISDGVRLDEGDTGPDVRALQIQLVGLGYDLALNGVYDARTHAVVAAFQRRYRPALVDGIADASTRETLCRLVEFRSR